MQKIVQSVTDSVYSITASTKFFVATLLLLVFQSVWMAFTAIYPLPFDEYAHVGTIQIYARQWSPFITQQPPEASLYGDITRTGSYLYHYLMSFPYRVLDIFIDNQTALIIGLRLINILMVVGALILFRQLFIMWKIPKRAMNVIFLLFVFTPIVPFVVAHVNYDNLILLIMPVVLMLGTRLIIGENLSKTSSSGPKSLPPWRDQNPSVACQRTYGYVSSPQTNFGSKLGNFVQEKRSRIGSKGDVAWNGVLYTIFGLAAMLAKETFAPLFAVITLYVAWRLWREHGVRFWHAFQKSFLGNIRQTSFIIALLGLLVIGGLVVERYGGNLVRYKTFIVECDKVQPESVCEDFGPWYRNRENLRKKPFTEERYGNPISFTQHWVSKSMRGFFIPFSHTPTQVVWDKEPFGPIVTKAILPVGFVFGCVALVFGLGAVALKRGDIFRDRPLRFALIICVGYLVALWVFNYRGYLRLGEAEAIQARYSYPILLLLFLLMVKSANDIISSKNIKASAVVITVLLFVWGGGIAGWLIRADDTWRWQNPTVQSVNQKVQTVLRYLVVH